MYLQYFDLGCFPKQIGKYDNDTKIKHALVNLSKKYVENIDKFTNGNGTIYLQHALRLMGTTPNVEKYILDKV